MTSTNLTLSEALNMAAAHLEIGNLEYAKSICEDILKAAPDQADALHLTGLAVYQEGRIEEAIGWLEKACGARPGDVELLNNLGNMLKAHGQLASAAEAYRQAVAADAQCLAAYYNLGNALFAMNQEDEAIASFNKAIQLKPDFSEAHYNLGIAFRQRGQIAQAVIAYQDAIAANPKFFDALVNYGSLLADVGNHEEALKLYERAIAVIPAAPPVFNNMGVSLTALGRYKEARAALEQALALDAGLVDAMNNLAVIERLTGEPVRSLSTLQSALERDPLSLEAHRNKGIVLIELGDFEAAVAALKQAVQLDPDYYEAYLDLGVAAYAACDSDTSRWAFQAAGKLSPRALAPRMGACMANLAMFFPSAREAESALRQFESDLDEVASHLDWESSQSVSEAARAVGLLSPYFLAVQDNDNCELMRKYGHLVCRIMSAAYPQWSQSLPQRQLKDGERYRIGIVSGDWNDRFSSTMFVRGWLEELDRERFDIYAYATSGVSDDMRRLARRRRAPLVDYLGFDALCERIAADKLDLILFPEIGQDASTLKVATLRLAPVQCAAWGLPQTTGLPTIDYFLSGDLMEPGDSSDHYTESLIRLPNLGSYYAPSNVEPEMALSALDALRADAVRYLCPLSLFKYDSAFDHWLVKIAERVRNAQFVFVGKPTALAGRFHERLRQAFERGGLDPARHLCILPKLSQEEFAGLARGAHACLDASIFSGALTTLAVLEQGVPVVTLPGRFARGRQALAMLSRMDVHETVAGSPDQYVEIAVRLGLDDAWRMEVKAKIDRSRYLVNHDAETIYALADFLESASSAK